MLNYQILNIMSIGSLRRLKTLDTHPNFQLKLTQLFINQLSTSIRFQSDFVIIAHSNDLTVNIYLCNQSYTSIQKSLTLLNVKSLEDLKVKYNHVSGQILIIYRKKNEIQLIKMNKNEDKRISQSYSDIRLTMNERYHCVPFQQQAHIINISDIVQTPGNRIYCLITVASGKVYMASFINQKLQIHNTKQENKFFSYFKNIAIGFKKQPLWSHKTCYTYSQVIQHAQSSPDLYALFLIDRQLYMKYFGQLGSQSREIDSWQLNQYENPLLGNCQIINCVFVPLQNQYEVELFVLCCVDEWKIVLYIMTINMKQKIKSIKTINNVFKNDQKMQSEDEPTLDYHKELDHIDIEYFNDKVYLLFSKNTQANSLMSKKVHYLAEVSKHQSQWSYCQFQMLQTSGGELRMIKTKKKKPNQIQEINEIFNQQNQSLLFIGESSCYSYQTDIQSYEEQQNLERMLEMSQSRRTPPPIPKYTQKEKEPTATYVPKPMPMPMPMPVVMAEPQNKKNYDYLDPFSKSKIEKYISKKEYGSLFNLLSIQKQQLYKQLSSVNSGSLNSQSFKKHLFILVIFKIFTSQKGLKPSLQIGKIKSILTKFSENDPSFLNSIFVLKDIKALQRIFKYLLQSKQYRLLYQICTQTIPNFMQMLVQSSQKSIIKKQQENKMENEGKNSQKSQPFSLFPDYLELYQNLAKGLSNKKMSENQQFKEYQHKQFLDKYFQMQSLIESTTQQQQKMMLQQNKKMIKLYIQNSDKMIKNFISFAIKYSNIGIFQQFILSKYVSKQDMCQFVNQNQRHSQDSIKRLYIDLINTEIAFIFNFKKKQHRGLHVLDWVPKQYQLPIFHFLQDHYPILALVYGLTIMPRRQLAIKLKERLNDLDKFTTAEQLLTVIGPLYSVACPEIKVNIDMALLLFEKNKKFTSYDQLTTRAFGVQPIKNQKWLQFQSKCSKYLSQQQIQQIKRNLKIN